MRRVLVATLVLGALAGGCRRKPPTGSAPTPTGPLSGTPGAQGPLVFDDRDVAIATLSGSLAPPKDWPKDFPIYPGAAIVADHGTEDAGPGEKGRLLILETRDSSPTVAAFYQRELAPHGKVLLDLELGVGRSMMFERPDGKTWMVMIMHVGSTTQIQLSEND